MSRSPYLHALDPQSTSEAPQAPVVKAGRYDPAKRRQSIRKQRERGCSLYIAAEELLAAGWPSDAPAPYYRVWGASRGGLFVRLYREA